ncbi:MAG: ParB family protein [Geminicoccaceae bacterium]
MINEPNPEMRPVAEAPARTNPPSCIDREVTVLDIDQLYCYEHNPRLLRNPKWLEIKASIRASRGLTETLSVTRRPDDDRYVVHQGGNTRLLVIKELFAETNDEAFRSVKVHIHPFVSEIEIAALHDRENTCRADLTYFEEAWSKFRQYELYCRDGLGKPSVAFFVRFMNERYGVSLTPYGFSRMKFAVEVLYQHIPTCLVQGAMSQRAIRRLINVQNALKAMWLVRRLGTRSEYDEVFFQLLSRQDKDLAASFVPADPDPAVFPDDRIAIDWALFREDFAHELTIVADVDHQQAEAWIAAALGSGEGERALGRFRRPPSSARGSDSDDFADLPVPSAPNLMELRASAVHLAQRFSAGTAAADCIQSTPGHGFGYRLKSLPADRASSDLAEVCWFILTICSGVSAPIPPKASIAELSPLRISIWACLINVQARIVKLAGDVVVPLPTNEMS